MPETKQERKRPTPTSAAARQAGDYEPPVLAEPKGGPVPKFRPTGEAARAGGEWWRLHKYWTQGEGLGRWANDPHPFKALLAFLMRHMPEEKARKTAYDWFKEVKGFAPSGRPPSAERETVDPVTQREQRERERRKQKRRRTARRSADIERANELKEYWLHGAGAARWTRWTDLYGHLKKHMADERAKRIAAEWFHERYGYWPGADKNRVAHGKPPRGDRIGPG